MTSQWTRQLGVNVIRVRAISHPSPTASWKCASLTLELLGWPKPFGCSMSLSADEWHTRKIEAALAVIRTLRMSAIVAAPQLKLLSPNSSLLVVVRKWWLSSWWLPLSSSMHLSLLTINPRMLLTSAAYNQHEIMPHCYPITQHFYCCYILFACIKCSEQINHQEWNNRKGSLVPSVSDS